MPAIKKDQIKDQMIKTVARLWNVADNEIETNFDPLVLLLIEACGAELERIGFDIYSSQERMIDKLAELIVPESVVGPKPASCIATATPLEQVAIVNPLTRFYITQRIQNGNNSSYNHNLFFTPAGNFNLLKAKLAYTLIGKKIFKINSNTSKELLFTGDTKANTQINEIWLAIEPDKALKSLKGLSIYFDLRSHSKANIFYSSLSNIKVWLDNNEINLEAGYFNGDQFELSPEEMLVSGHDYSKKVNRNIAGIYENHFLHIADDISVTAGTVPEFLQQVLSKQVFQKISSEPLIYLKIQLNRYFFQEELDGLTCSINAFPVVNRKFNTQNYRTDVWINTIPLQVEGSFLDLQSITTAAGGNYIFRITAGAQNIEEGEAFVRSTGIGKPTSKEVREIISNLINSIRDENSYFLELNNDFIIARLKEMNQILSRLEDQMQKANDSKAAHHYILLKPKKAGETVTINYWSTDGELANQVRTGSLLIPHNHTLVSNKEAYTITNTVGGKTNITDAEKKFLLKQQLSSNGKIISAEDIKMLCRQLFGNDLTKVTIKKGVQIGSGNSEGFSRTIDIILNVQNKDDVETDYICRELMHILKNKATIVYPFRVMIEHL